MIFLGCCGFYQVICCPSDFRLPEFQCVLQERSQQRVIQRKHQLYLASFTRDESEFGISFLTRKLTILCMPQVTVNSDYKNLILMFDLQGLPTHVDCIVTTSEDFSRYKIMAIFRPLTNPVKVPLDDLIIGYGEKQKKKEETKEDEEEKEECCQETAEKEGKGMRREQGEA